jgi:hypothetical protein
MKTTGKGSGNIVNHEVESVTVDEAAEDYRSPRKTEKVRPFARREALRFLPDTFTFARNDCHALTELVLAEFTAKRAQFLTGKFQPRPQSLK